jgi:hypothetical protein
MASSLQARVGARVGAAGAWLALSSPALAQAPPAPPSPSEARPPDLPQSEAKPPRTEAWFTGVLPSEALGEVDKTAARLLLDTARRKFEAGELEAALEAFRNAHAMVGLPATGLWLARGQEKVGLLVEATATAQRVQRYPVQPNEPGAFTDARHQAAALQKEIAPRIPSILVEVSGSAARAAYEVTIDDVRVPTSARKLPAPVNPGSHRISVSARGHETTTQNVSVKEGERRVVAIALRPTRTASEPAGGPGSSGPEKAAEPAPGGPNMPLWGIVGFCVAGASLAGGVVTGALSLGEANRLQDRCPAGLCADADRADYDRMIGLANASNVAFAVAGAGAVVGVIGLILGDAPAGDARAALGLTPGGAVVGGAF